MNNPENTNKLVECSQLTKDYIDANNSQNGVKTSVLKGVNLTIHHGEQIAILGQSGSGKSTLLHILGMLDDPTTGQLTIEGKSITEFNETQRALYRNDNMGFIYQFHHLLMEFSALENVAMPLLIKGEKRALAYEKAKYLLDQVGLGHRFDHTPSQLSGGERQRVAIARALVNQPKLVLADEPTGNLDKTNAQQVFDLFLKLNKENNTALVVVTHDMNLAQQFERVIKIDDGRVV